MSTTSSLSSDTTLQAAPLPASHSTTGAARRRPWHASGLPVALAILFLAGLLLALVVPSLVTHDDPLRGNFLQSLKPPSAAHWLGTDRLGRDILSRIIHGARYSLTIGIGAMLLSAIVGVVAGVLAGTGGRWLDETIGRVFDVLSAFPGVLVAMLVVTFLGASMVNVAIAIGIAGIPKFGRVVRAETRLVRMTDYVTLGVVYGATPAASFRRHLLPNVLAVIPVIATLDIGTAILAVSGLSFLGLGPQPPTPEWGVMLAESRDVLRVAWWPSLFPGLALTCTVIAFTVLGASLQARFERREGHGL